MSEIKLNLTDAHQIIHGTIHGSIADRAVAALSAEPETIAELEAALARFMKPDMTIGPFASFHECQDIDEVPWDAGIMIIDLAARIVACESTYSQPHREGAVDYHNGQCATDIQVLYCLPDDWIFLKTIAEYQGLRDRRHERLANPPFNTRAILYGAPLLEFISRECMALDYNAASGPASLDCQKAVAHSLAHSTQNSGASIMTADSQVTTSDAWTEESVEYDPIQEQIARQISTLHARWLMTPRDDLRGKTPREVLLSRREFIDHDLHTRELQWSLQGEGPPCLATHSFAYRFAGFGTHEWVIYYDLVRYLFWSAATLRRFCSDDLSHQLRAVEQEALTARLEELKNEWLDQPQTDYDGRTPAILIENERRRLPIAMLGRDMVIDDDCPVCQMMGAQTGLGLEVGFWHLDGCNMDEGFAFSTFQTIAEWEADRREWEEFNRKFNREWQEREQQERASPTS